MTSTTENLADRPTNGQSSEVDRVTAELFARIFKAYDQASQSIKDVIETMTHIINDPDSEQDERLAAIETLREALFPSKFGDRFGVDLEETSGEDAEADQKGATFAFNVRKLLKSKNMTQHDLAKAVGLGQPAVAMLLSRECRPQKATVRKIADALGVAPHELWPD